MRDTLCHKAAQSLSKPLKTAQQSLPKPYKTLQSRQGLPKPPRASQRLAIPPKPSQKPYKASGSKNTWKVNGKTRDVCAKHAILNEEIRYSHKRWSANPVKMQSNLTSLSPNTVKTLLRTHRKIACKPQLASGTACHPVHRIRKESHKYKQIYVQSMRLATAESKRERKNTRRL